jgi:exodeoxyribonuclease V alpha subunit
MEKPEPGQFPRMTFMRISPTLQELKGILSDPELFSSMDKHFALFTGRLAKNHSPAVALAAALVSRKTGEGNICLDLAEYAGKPLRLDFRKTVQDAYVCPPLPDWTEQLLQSGVAGQDEGNTPLVLGGSNRLYLRRYWQYEQSISRFIRERATPFLHDLNFTRLSNDLGKLFHPQPPGEIDWQQVAAIAAVTRSFSVISGGPGTGKTATVAKILALLMGQCSAPGQLRILLGAPTGKAASRLQQAITAAGLGHTGSESLQASTLHRMLGYIPNSPYFRHNAENHLAADIIVIDEASMVDLPLLAKLMAAVPASSRLILLGDRHQLASVQPGSVLGDICRSEIMPSFSNEFCQLVSELSGNSIAPASHSSLKTASPALQDSFVELVQSYRFSPESGIAKLSMAVKEGDGEKALDLLLEAEDGTIAWSEIPAPAELGKKLFNTPDIALFASMPPNVDPGSCFDQLDSFRILCALRRGPFGMERVNTLLEQELLHQLQEDRSHHTAGQFTGKGSALPFRPVMVTENDYNLRLFNGDVGIILPDPENPQSMRAFFREEYGILRHVAPSLLPGHETVFAMTVHKSQGSEFDRVLLILPDRDSPLLTRELLYTAITRGREKVEIWGRKAIFISGVTRQIKRTSGLAEALWGGDV